MNSTSSSTVIDRTTRSGAVYASCVKAARCGVSSMFNLDALVDSAMQVEEGLIASYASNPNVDSLANLDVVLDHIPSDSTHQVPLSETPFGSSSPPVPSERPRRLNYQHWLRKQAYEDNVVKNGQVPCLKTLKDLIPKAAKAATKMDFKFFDLPVANGAYRARFEKPSALDKVYTLEEAKAMGICVFEWDGIEPVPFIDKEGHIFMVLAGRPDREDYVQDCHKLYASMEKEKEQNFFTPNEASHRRGEYPLINVGVTHGMGTLRPTCIKHEHRSETVQRLMKSSCLRRIAIYGSSAFAIWGPKTYKYYKERLDLMYLNGELPRMVPRSIFPAGTLNFGPKVCTRKHKDCQNCPFGWCTVTPIGEYDPKNGGHLIVWELGIAIEFPPGSTILLPSAALSHSNTAIGVHEKRASFTQYASGGLFRWVDYGFQLEGDLKKKDPSRYEEIVQLRSQKWRVGVDMFSTISELEALIND